MMLAALVSAALAAPTADRSVYVSARGDLVGWNDRDTSPVVGLDVSVDHQGWATTGAAVAVRGDNEAALGGIYASARTAGPVAAFLGVEAGDLVFEPSPGLELAQVDRQLYAAPQAGLRFQNGGLRVRLDGAVGRSGDALYTRAGLVIGLGFRQASADALVRR